MKELENFVLWLYEDMTIDVDLLDTFRQNAKRDIHNGSITPAKQKALEIFVTAVDEILVDEE